MRKAFAARFMPLSFVEDWRTRADDCLVYGASLAGAHKYHLAELLVDYRVHSHNTFAGQRPKRQARYRHRLALTRLFEHVIGRLGYNPFGLADLIHREFDTIANPAWRDLMRYYRAIWHSRMPLWRRMAMTASVTGSFCSPRRRSGQTNASPQRYGNQNLPGIIDSDERAA